MSTAFRTARIASHFLAFVFGVVGFSTGINALVKSNHQKDELHNAAPTGVDISIDTSDVFASGVVVTVVCGLIALTALASLATTFVARFASRTTHRVQGALFAFLSTWLFATVVPFTDFIANRQATVSATLGGVQLPQSIIQQAQEALGVTNDYHQINYLRVAAALPWIAFLFGVTSAIFEFAASRTISTSQHPAARNIATTYELEDEKKTEQTTEAAV
ncbi:hypothetical protein B0H21DRAFT_697430 [Amylocystis lapponica]|nr:hypothetical protein B0H21DRAFT_697430 [Amylocystis lapponica]